jgi:hypothetical protein
MGAGFNINDPEVQKLYLQAMAKYGGLAPKEKQAMIQQEMAKSLRNVPTAKTGMGALAQGLSGWGEGAAMQKAGALHEDIAKGRNEEYQKLVDAFIAKNGRPPTEQELEQLSGPGTSSYDQMMLADGPQPMGNSAY